MRNTISAIATFGLIALAPVAAQASASKQENIGVGTGAAIGAAAGGPVGLIIGAAIGARIGDDFYRKTSEIDSLAVSLEQSRGQVANLERDVSDLDTEIDSLSAELGRMQRIARPEVISLLQAGIVPH